MADFILTQSAFNHFTRRDAALLMDYCTEKSLTSGTILFQEGDTGTSLYIIRSGQLKIYKHDLLGDMDIALLGSGAIVGDLAILDSQPRSANVKAANTCSLLEMKVEDYHLLQHAAPDVAIKFMNILLTTLASRLRTTVLKVFRPAF